MRTMTVLYGIFLAALFAVAAPISQLVLQCVFQPWFAFRITVSAAVVAYAVMILPRSTRRSGRIFTLTAISAFQAALLFVISPLWAFVLGSVGVVWITRSLLLARSILHIATEAALVGAGFFCAIFAAKVTGSFAIAIWSMLLVLAAGSLIGKPFERRPEAARARRSSVPRFERAHASAEQAIAAMARE